MTKQTLDRENVSEGCTIRKLRNYILLTSLEECKIADDDGSQYQEKGRSSIECQT